MDKVEEYEKKINGFYGKLEKLYNSLPPEIRKHVTARNLAILGVLVAFLFIKPLLFSKPRKVNPRRPQANIEFQKLSDVHETINAVHIPLKIPLTNLRKYLNSKAPTYIPVNEGLEPPNIPETPLPNQTSMSFIGDVELGTIILAPNTNSFQTTIPIKGEFKSLINYELDIGIPGLNSSSRFQTFHYAGDVSINSYPTVSPDWELEPNIRARVSFAEAYFDFDPILDLRKEATLFADEVIEKEIAKVEKQILDSFNFRRALQPMWNLLSHSYILSRKNKTYISFDPSKIYYEDTKTEDGILHLGVKLVYICRTYVDQKPPSKALMKIPTMIDGKGQKDSFDLKLPFTIQYKDLNYSLTKKHYMTKYESDLGLLDHDVGGGKFSILDVELFGDANFSYFKVGFKSKNARGKKVAGNLYLRATPKLQNGHIKFTDIKYTKETRYALTRSAKWLLNDEVYKMVEDFSSYDISEEVYLLENDLNTRLGNVGVKEDIGVAFQGRVKVQNITNLTLQDSCFSLLAQASGELKADTDYLKGDLRPVVELD